MPTAVAYFGAILRLYHAIHEVKASQVAGDRKISTESRAYRALNLALMKQQD
jgi:hypothetical protein